MQALLLLTCVVVGTLAATTPGTPAVMGTTENPDGGVNSDPFIAFIKELEVQPFFRLLSSENKLLTFEMLTAAETNHLGQLLDSLGYITLLTYLDALPKDFSHRFITYSIEHLEAEVAAQA